MLISYYLLTACSNSKAFIAQPETKFKYINQAGDIAVWDINAHTISYPNGKIELNTCNAENKYCFEGDWVKIIMPQSCEEADFYRSEETYRPLNGITNAGLEPHTGGIGYFESIQKKFGYIYHPSRGVTAINLIPLNSPIQADSGFVVFPYYYHLETDNGPFSCLSPK